MRFREFSLFENKRWVLDEATLHDVEKGMTTILENYHPIIDNRQYSIELNDHNFQRADRLPFGHEGVYAIFAKIKDEDLVSKAFNRIAATETWLDIPVRLKNGENSIYQVFLKRNPNTNIIVFDTTTLSKSLMQFATSTPKRYTSSEINLSDLSNQSPEEIYARHHSIPAKQLSGIPLNLPPIQPAVGGNYAVNVSTLINKKIDTYKQAVISARNKVLRNPDSVRAQRELTQYSADLDNIIQASANLPKDNNGKIIWNTNDRDLLIQFANQYNVYDSKQFHVNDDGVIRHNDRNDVINTQNTAAANRVNAQRYRQEAISSLRSLEKQISEANAELEKLAELGDTQSLTLANRYENIYEFIIMEADDIITNPETYKELKSMFVGLQNTNILNATNRREKTRILQDMAKSITELFGENTNTETKGVGAYVRYLQATGG